MANLEGPRVAILVTDGFEQVELLEPCKALDQAGAETRVVSPKDERVRGWDFTNWGVATGGVRVLNDNLVAGLHIPDHLIDAVAARELEELRRRDGDFEYVHRCGVLTVDSRAGQYKYYDIENAATHLHGMIDKTRP